MIYDVSTQTNCGEGEGGVKSVISDNCIFSILECVVCRCYFLFSSKSSDRVDN